MQLDDPRLRAAAVASLVQTITSNTALCADHARTLAARQWDELFLRVGPLLDDRSGGA